MQDINTSERER